MAVLIWYNRRSMKGYLYITSTGYDPEKGKHLNDPYLGDTPTLGACRPDIRSRVIPGDFIFVISGKVKNVQQFLIAGFEVREKIDAMVAYEEFPKLRLHLREDGQRDGNVIVNSRGKQHPLDTHDPKTFERRIRDYVVGRNPLALSTTSEIARGRQETMDMLRYVTAKGGTTPISLVGRGGIKLDDSQVRDLKNWLESVKRGT